MEYINMDKRFKISKTLIINFIFLLLFITAVTQPSDGFGYDSANSCSTQASKLSRRGRAQTLAAIPCDLTRQAYCHLPGSAYPWHAVRRFVHENHGLMKRMYGDVRHISVLRDEILNNEIDIDDVEDAAERYSKQPHRVRAAKYMHAQREEVISIKNNDVLMEPHFRPVSTTTTTTTSTPELAKEENTNADSERVQARMEEEQQLPLPARIAGGTLRRRSNVSSTSGGHRRRVNVYVNRNRPMHSSLRRRTTTTTTTEEPKLWVENEEQTSETLLHEETILEIPEDDGNLASNSVYEVATSPEATLHMGDNIQIIESPQLGQLQKPLSEQKNSSESATLSTTLKVVTIPSAHIRPSLDVAYDSPASVAPTILQQNPTHQTERQRPNQPPSHKLKLQQVNKLHPIAEAGGTKESSTLKSKPANESERTQSHTALVAVDSSAAVTQPLKAATNDDADVTTDAENGTTLSNVGTTNTDTDVTAPAIAAAPTVTATASAGQTSAPQQYEHLKNKNEHDFGENKADLPSTVTSEQTIPTTIATKLTSTQAELTSASKATISPPGAASVSGELAAAQVELLADEKIQRPLQTAPEQQPYMTPSHTTPISAAAAASTKPVLRDGQLYQDALKQEVKPSANMRGINACAVKEEVVAPFWANNTRGEVLALLNLYPFEQYVHWEKCTHEHRQMYCRDGCLCEQQYRLHRLLAYDPHNECRGIFSDWFRFPSCCICKCYGMPMEFRATSRSPRSERMDEFETIAEETEYEDDIENADETIESPEEQQRRHPIDVAEQLVRQAIYEHATEDWYRPKDEFDFYEG